MKFLEAYQWMNESEDNICLKSGRDNYKVIKGAFVIFYCNRWIQSEMPISSLSKADWRKKPKKKVITFHEAIVTYEDGSAECMEVTADYFEDEDTVSKPICIKHTFTGEYRKVEVPE